MPKTDRQPSLCAACGRVGEHRLRISINHSPVRLWWLCHQHAQLIAQQDFALQFDPEWGGTWLSGKDTSARGEEKGG